MLIRIRVPRSAFVLACTLSCLYCFKALPLTRFQIECVTLDVLDDFLIHHFSLEALERALQAFAIVYVYFSQWNYLGSVSDWTLKGNSFPPRARLE